MRSFSPRVIRIVFQRLPSSRHQDSFVSTSLSDWAGKQVGSLWIHLLPALRCSMLWCRVHSFDAFSETPTRTMLSSPASSSRFITRLLTSAVRVMRQLLSCPEISTSTCDMHFVVSASQHCSCGASRDPLRPSKNSVASARSNAILRSPFCHPRVISRTMSEPKTLMLSYPHG